METRTSLPAGNKLRKKTHGISAFELMGWTVDYVCDMHADKVRAIFNVKWLLD